MEHDSHNVHQHGHRYGIYVLVWLALMVLTGVTVAVAGIDFGALTITMALVIASLKSYLVLTIFMHLRLEQPAFKWFVAVAIFFFLISIVLLFADYSYL
jgi:cytochrome c oxidase subunit IV